MLEINRTPISFAARLIFLRTVNSFAFRPEEFFLRDVLPHHSRDTKLYVMQVLRRDFLKKLKTHLRGLRNPLILSVSRW